MTVPVRGRDGSSSDVSMARTIGPHRDERLTLYLLIVVGGAALAVLTGELRLAIIAAPFATGIALGLVRRDAVPVNVRCSMDSVRCVEGDTVHGRIDIDAPPELAIEIRLSEGSGSLAAPDGQPWAWHIPAGTKRPIGVPVDIEAALWGYLRPGTIVVRLIDHGSLLVREAMLFDVPTLTVLPNARNLDRLLPPAKVDVAAGMHLANRRVGDGYDFAEIRDFRPGDRVRDVNWRATMRRDEVQVNRRHPERAGDVVIVIDPLPDGVADRSEVGRDLAIRTGRAAWEIARAHLAANDRVGIAAEGARTRYLAPRTGRRARYAVLEAVMDALTPSAALRFGTSARAIDIPPAALVVTISPLERPLSIGRLVSLRKGGRSVVVVAVDVGELTARADPNLPSAVSRLARLSFESRVAELRRRGVPVVEWGADQDIARIVLLLDRLAGRHGRSA